MDGAWSHQMSQQPISIGQLAKTAGVKVQTIRYYEEIGLMPEPARTQSNRRIYDSEGAKRLNFIRHARDLGFSIPAIRALIELQSNPEESCDAADEIARDQLASVKSKITRLKALQKELQRMLEHCEGDNIASCRIMEVLSDHTLCASDHAPQADKLSS